LKVVCAARSEAAKEKQFMISRQFLVTMLVGAACGHCLAAAPPKPDILLIMPDQMRGDCLSCVGHPVVKTPHLDQLARQGMIFRRAYSTAPSCIPARYALLTGLHPQTSGVVGFRGKPIDAPTLPGLLAGSGYATILAGRSMHQVPPDRLYGYQQWVQGSTYIDDDDYDTELKKASPASGGIRKVIGSLALTYNGWQARPWPLADDEHPTAWVVSQSRKIIAQAPGDRPLFLTTSFYAPHSPLFPPKKYFDRYMRQDLPPAAHGNWVDWKALPSPDKGRELHRVLLPSEMLHAAQAGYFGLIEHIDDQIGPLVDDFRARSEKAGRPWLIVFTSDHGELLGDNGYYRKCEPYEGSANIPFIIIGSPGLGFQPGGRTLRPVCLEDILPTLLELAGITPPQPMDGVSLVPALRGEKQVIRQWLQFEHATCYNQAQAFQALTDGRVKYIWRPLNGKEQLFDLDRDPKEEHDLSQDPGHQEILVKWRGVLIAQLAHRPEGFSDGHRLIAGRPYPPLQARPPVSKTD
jgi:arylsulfatase